MIPPSTTTASPPRKIVIAIPPNAQPIDISGPLGAFREANRQSHNGACYEVILVSTLEDTTITIDGMTVCADANLSSSITDIDTLLVAGTYDYRQAFSMTTFHQWLKKQVPTTKRYGSVCTGAFFLAEAGLLTNRTVTTHWQHATELAQRYPDITVTPDAIYVQDQTLCTSAGISAGIDLTLKLIEDDYGRDLALKVARRLVVFLQRSGGQSQFSAHLAAQSTQDDRIHNIQQWALKHLTKDLSLSALASRSAMSVRNFSRVFLRETGMTPADFVELARIDTAKYELEKTNRTLQQVASQCGFSSADIMRRAFMRRISVGPSEYRKRFRRSQ